MNETNTNSPATKAPWHQKDTPAAKNASALVRGIFNLALLIWAVRDIRRRSADEIKGNRKFWMMAAFAPPIGPIAYFLFGRKRNTQQEIPLSAADSVPQTDAAPLKAAQHHVSKFD